MKKVLSMMLVLIMVVGLMAVVASAAAPTISVSNASGATGNTVVVKVSINDNPGFASGKVELSWDKEALKLVDMKGVKFIGSVNADKGIANHFQGVVEGDGVLCEATFEVLAAHGNHTVTANVTGMRTADGEMLVNGETFSGSVSVEHEHAYGEWVIVKEATCGEDGLKNRTCACGEVEEKVIPATGEHTYGEYVVTKEATCKETGEKVRTCSVCGHEDVKSIAKAKHHYEGGKCVWCGKKKPAPKPDKDNIADTGDITPVITMGVVAMISVVAAAAYVTKRRITK